MKVHPLISFFLVIMFPLIQGCSEACSGSNKSKTVNLAKRNAISWDVKGNLWKAYVVIDGRDAWLKLLGITDKNKKETVVVNAANSNIQAPGGGIDGALGNWAKANGTTPWTNPSATLPSGASAPGQLEPGKFALFPVSFGHIYLAVGPTCGQVKTLAKTSNLLGDLYYNILTKAQHDHMQRVVLCAVSTAIFAGDGTESETGQKFTKVEFLQNVYEGAQSGIAKFQQEHPNHTLQIILNNWGRLGTTGPHDGVGLGIVKEVKDLS